MVTYLDRVKTCDRFYGKRMHVQVLLKRRITTLTCGLKVFPKTAGLLQPPVVSFMTKTHLATIQSNRK